MYKLFHFFYLLIGHFVCKCCLIYWDCRDFLFPPQEKAVLFVAHPDDDTLFFHTFIKEYKPYVCLCTTGWSLRRLPCFFKAMKYYGVRYRAYDMATKDTRVDVLRKRIHQVMQLGNFEICATHNKSGEYGHIMHQRVHDAVVSQVKCPVWVPVDASQIEQYPLSKQNFQEKEFIFNKIYVTESWVLDQNFEWVKNECLIRV